MLLLPNCTWPPAERLLASAAISLTGNWRSASNSSITSPTAPVAPTTATRNPLFRFAHDVL
jgi:hypothetical protein